MFKGNGFMIHLEGAQSTNELEFFTDYVLKKAEGEKLKIYVTGASIERNDENEESIIDDRIFVEDFLKEKFKDSELTIKWSENNTTTELFLDTETGKFDIESDKNEDYLD